MSKVMSTYYGKDWERIVVRELGPNLEDGRKGGQCFLINDSGEFRVVKPVPLDLDGMIEMEAYSTLKHEAIIGFHGFDYTVREVRNIGPLVHVVVDYCPKGSLGAMIKSELEGKAPSEWNATAKMKVIYGLASGMKCIHSKGFILKRLYPESIFLTDQFEPKISDFSGIRVDCHEEIASHGRHIGEYIFDAPELLCDSDYDQSCDVYSFAMILLSICSPQSIKDFCVRSKNGAPKSLFDHVKDLTQGRRPDIPKDISAREPIIEPFINRCWDSNPNCRPTFEDIIHCLREHTELWLKGTNKDELIAYMDKIDASSKSSHDFFHEEMQKILIPRIPPRATQASEYVMNRDDIITVGKLRKDSHNNEIQLCQLAGHPHYELFAQKIIEFGDSDASASESTTLFERETEILANVNHPCITKLVGIVLPGPDSPGLIITEFLKNGTLEDVLNSVRAGSPPLFWTPTAMALVVVGLAHGMWHLHSHDILHRDLKPSNIYLDDNHLVRIAGLESGRFASDMSTMTQNIETPMYLAPEIGGDGDYDKKVDVYAFGLILFEILTGERVFSENLSYARVVQNARNGVRPEIPETIHEDIRQLISACWDVAPTRRPSAWDIVEKLTKIEFKIIPGVVSEFVKQYYLGLAE